MPLPFRKVDSRFDHIDLFYRQHLRQMITQLRTLQQFGRIILDISVGYKELIETTDTTENTTLRTGSHTDIMERGSKVLQILQLHILWFDLLTI